MPKQFYACALALILALCVGGCAAVKCSPEYCATDAKITEQVRAIFDQRTEYGPPGSIQGADRQRGRVFERQGDHRPCWSGARTHWLSRCPTCSAS